jgi:hypothetical protein
MVLAREACYRAIGEAFFEDAVAKQVDFPAWYQNELAELLKVRRQRLHPLLSPHALNALQDNLTWCCGGTRAASWHVCKASQGRSSAEGLIKSSFPSC